MQKHLLLWLLLLVLLYYCTNKCGAYDGHDLKISGLVPHTQKYDRFSLYRGLNSEPKEKEDQCILAVLHTFRLSTEQSNNANGNGFFFTINISDVLYQAVLPRDHS